MLPDMKMIQHNDAVIRVIFHGKFRDNIAAGYNSAPIDDQDLVMHGLH